MSGPNFLTLDWWQSNSSIGFGTFTLNQSTDALEFVFQVPPGSASYTISRLGFRQGTVTGTSPTYRVSLQGVGADGNPDGSIKAGGNAFADVTPVAGGNSTWQWVNLGSTYAASPGEILSIVIAYTGSSTIDASNNCSFTSTNSLQSHSNTWYAISNDNGVRSRITAWPCFGWGTASTAYGSPAETVVNTNFNSGSTPDEKAVKINIPKSWGFLNYQIVGARWNLTVTTGSTYELVLYDTDGTTELQAITVDTDIDRSNGAESRLVMFDEAVLSTLKAGQNYRLAIRPGASNLAVNVMFVDAAADLEAWPFGSALIYSQRTNGGAWSDDATGRPFIVPILTNLQGGARLVGASSLVSAGRSTA